MVHESCTVNLVCEDACERAELCIAMRDDEKNSSMKGPFAFSRVIFYAARDVASY